MATTDSHSRETRFAEFRFCWRVSKKIARCFEVRICDSNAQLVVNIPKLFSIGNCVLKEEQFWGRNRALPFEVGRFEVVFGEEFLKRGSIDAGGSGGF